MTSAAWPGRAVLQVPVPGLEGPVRARYERDDPSLLGADPTHVHAHVTVLGPVPCPLGARSEVLRVALAACPSFDYVLGEVAAFPNGIVHVLPLDPTPFTRLTDTARRALPGVQPYGGEFAPTPHVTIDALREGVTGAGIRAELAPLLPVRGRATCVELVWYRAHEVRVLARYPMAP